MRQLFGNIEQFISLVQSRPALYNFTLDEFNDKDLTQKLWEEIASEFNTNVDYCKSKWGILRVSFARQMRNERTNANNSSETFRNDWYLKNNMSFMRNYMRKRKKCNSIEKNVENFNNDSLTKSNFEVKTELTSLNSALAIKSEPLYIDENESLASLEIGSNEDLLEDNIPISDLFSIASNSVTNIETRHSIESHQTNRTSDSYPESNSKKKRKASQQEEQSSILSKILPTDREHELPLKKKSNEAEDPLILTFCMNKIESENITSPYQHKTTNADATMHFFKSILPDFNKLTGRRQRLVKQKLMESLNRLLDEQEND